MKRKVLLLFCLMVISMKGLAQNPCDTLDLGVGYIPPGGLPFPRHKAPATPPMIVQEGYELSFVSGCPGYVVQLSELQNGEETEVYSTTALPGATTLHLLLI